MVARAVPRRRAARSVNDYLSWVAVPPWLTDLVRRKSHALSKCARAAYVSKTFELGALPILRIAFIAITARWAVLTPADLSARLLLRWRLRFGC